MGGIIFLVGAACQASTVGHVEAVDADTALQSLDVGGLGWAWDTLVAEIHEASVADTSSTSRCGIARARQHTGCVKVRQHIPTHAAAALLAAVPQLVGRARDAASVEPDEVGRAVAFLGELVVGRPTGTHHAAAVVGSVVPEVAHAVAATPVSVGLALDAVAGVDVEVAILAHTVQPQGFHILPAGDCLLAAVILVDLGGGTQEAGAVGYDSIGPDAVRDRDAAWGAVETHAGDAAHDAAAGEGDAVVG